MGHYCFEFRAKSKQLFYYHNVRRAAPFRIARATAVIGVSPRIPQWTGG